MKTNLSAARIKAGYLNPTDRDSCGRCASCQPHTTESGVRTNSNDCRRHFFLVKLDGWCPSFRSKESTVSQVRETQGETTCPV